MAAWHEAGFNSNTSWHQRESEVIKLHLRERISHGLIMIIHSVYCIIIIEFFFSFDPEVLQITATNLGLANEFWGA